MPVVENSDPRPSASPLDPPGLVDGSRPYSVAPRARPESAAIDSLPHSPAYWRVESLPVARWTFGRPVGAASIVLNRDSASRTGVPVLGTGPQSISFATVPR